VHKKRTRQKMVAPRRRKIATMLVQRSPAAKAHGPFAPKREGDVGYDLVCTELTVIPPGAHLPPIEIQVGTRIKLPPGTFAMIVSRSSTFERFPELLLCAAPIDNGYTGPIGPRFKNLGRNAVTIMPGVCLAQLVVYGSCVPRAVEVDELPATQRGTRRFGSTGH
jgi:dUTP pyrophosphatase